MTPFSIAVENPCKDQAMLNMGISGRVSLLGDNSFLSASQKGPEVGWLIPLLARMQLEIAFSCGTSWSQVFRDSRVFCVEFRILELFMYSLS